jgi:hypothetical protein
VELVPRASSLYNLALALFSLERYAECVQVTDRVVEVADPADQAAYREYAGKLRERALAAAVAAQSAERAAPPAPTPSAPDANAPSQLDAPILSVPAPSPSAPVVSVHALPVAKGDPADGGIPAPGWFVIGGGALALAGALVTGLLANSADDAFTHECPDARGCDPAVKPLAQRAQRLALATDILLATGVVACGTGVTLLLVDDGGEDDTRALGTVHGVGLALSGELP